jgi:hypothetical protein
MNLIHKKKREPGLGSFLKNNINPPSSFLKADNGKTFHSNYEGSFIAIGDMGDRFTSSFKEFQPFCSELYYFSSFKKFKTVRQPVIF